MGDWRTAFLLHVCFYSKKIRHFSRSPGVPFFVHVGLIYASAKHKKACNYAGFLDLQICR
jgi:hypothetical protein